MYCKVTCELPEDTRTAFFNNYLVNLSGKEDSFIKLDLMQEYYNFWLEELAQYKSREFSNTWYRMVLAMHVYHFLHLKEEMETMVDLVPLSRTELRSNSEREQMRQRGTRILEIGEEE